MNKYDCLVTGSVKWLARVIGFLACGFFLLFIIGEGMPSIIRGQAKELLPFLPLLITGILGYIIAWFSELAGGVLLIASGVAMATYLLLILIGGSHNLKAALIYGAPFVITGILFIIFWWLYRRCGHS